MQLLAFGIYGNMYMYDLNNTVEHNALACYAVTLTRLRALEPAADRSGAAVRGTER